jgi:hypothetical protein
MQTIAILLAILVLVAIVVAATVRRRRHPIRYELQRALLTRSEIAFYRALFAGVGGLYLIAPKVRVADVLKAPRDKNRRAAASAFNRISQKHFDFVLCDPQTFTVLAAIELDDRSHESPDRRARDAMLDRAANDAGLALLRFKARASYTVDEIQKTFAALSDESEFSDVIRHVAKL